ncbi:DUF4410 domain-containing protein [Halomonas urmiana]|uniref:DUF4410 domain-containing protein n=1 Tax=Halomonas urmiana TaxID=490901 RepID=A0A5R8MIK6_9GAMM|nr:DUF4410 domain-containing protein [Halomonas urmiana]TLF51794.1 DUF4410 domain-containing protein [Halomonas urmiana]
MKRILFIFCLLLLLVGCGAPHVRTDKAAAGLDEYPWVQVLEVEVDSTEQKGNHLRLNREFSDYASRRIRGVIEESGFYQLVDVELIEGPGALVVETHMNITYGSRARRYWVGFGAGKGSVRTVLAIRRAEDGTKLLQLASDSDLSVGAFGGSMDITIRENIDELIAELRRQLP